MNRHPLLALTLAFGLLAGCATSLAAAQRTIRIGHYENAPKVFTDEHGQPAGIFVDIIRYIARQEGWRLEFIPGSWAQGLARLTLGEIDLMPDVARTTDREQEYSLQQVSVISSWFQVYARKGSGIESILDLRNKKIAVLDRSVQQAAFRKLAESFGISNVIIGVDDYSTVFRITAEGKVDAAIVNQFFGNMNAKKYGLVDTSVVFNPSSLHFAAPKFRNSDLLATIDRHLIELKKDTRSVYYRSLTRWTAEDVETSIPSWIPVTGLGILGALLISLSISIVFKHKLDDKTRQLRESNAEMEKKIEERTRDLATALERAKEADYIKSAFLATMSHELRTPLNSIIGFTGIMLQGLAGPLNAEQAKQMGMVQNSSRHLLSLINDVLDISKIEAGQLEIVAAEFDLRAAVEKIARMLAPLAEQKGIAFALDIADNVGAFTADQRRVEQVIINLANNAIKFTERGQVTLACSVSGGTAKIRVEDSGIGIKAGDIPSLFTPFHQIDNGLSRKHEGTGLGLSISQRIVELMHGAIDVTSEYGQGSVFTVYLPNQTEARA